MFAPSRFVLSWCLRAEIFPVIRLAMVCALVTTAGSAIAQSTSSSVAEILQNSGYRLALENSRTSPTRVLIMKWRSSDGVLELTQSTDTNDPPPLQRAKNISPNQIVAIALDRSGTVKSYQIIPDSRNVTSETRSPTGDVVKSVAVRSDVTIEMFLPTKIEIAEIRLLEPKMDTGTEPRLEEVAALDVSGTRP